MSAERSVGSEPVVGSSVPREDRQKRRLSRWRLTAAAMLAGANTLFPSEVRPAEAQGTPGLDSHQAAAKVEELIASQDVSAILTLLSDQFVAGPYTGASEGPAGQRASRSTQAEIVRKALATYPECLRWRHFPGNPERALLLFNNFPEKDKVGFLVLENENINWKISAFQTIDWEEWEKFVRNDVEEWNGCPSNSSSGSENTKRLKFEELPKEHKVFLEIRERYVFVGGVVTTVISGGVGEAADNLFSTFQIDIGRKHGMTGTDIIHFSWGGWYINPENGLYYPKDQSCQDTLEDPRERASQLVEFFLQWFSYHPNDRLTVYTHSEGVQPVLFAMEIIKKAKEANPNYPIDPAKINFIFTHAPALGVNPQTFEIIGKYLSLVPDDCKVGPTGLPVPGMLKTPAGKNLVLAWDNRVKRAKEIAEILAWWQKNGSKDKSAGNWQDGAISQRYGFLPAAVLKVLVLLDPGTEILKTQQVPGAKPAVMLYLGHSGIIGHDALWATSTGRSTLEDLTWGHGKT